jgi:DNA-binding MarR family transcriptional regulator
LNLGLLLFIPYRALEKEVLDALAEAGFDDITLAQARVFQRIARDGSRLTELAEAAQVTKQTVGFLVDQLERGGYVERTPDPRDGRARRVRVAVRGAVAVRGEHGRHRRDRGAVGRAPRPNRDGPAARGAHCAARDHRPLRASRQDGMTMVRYFD